MRNIVLMSDTMVSIAIFLIIASPFALLVGLGMVAASKNTRKTGIQIIIGAVIAFIIGFGTCFSNL